MGDSQLAAKEDNWGFDPSPDRGTAGLRCSFAAVR